MVVIVVVIVVAMSHMAIGWCDDDLGCWHCGCGGGSYIGQLAWLWSQITYTL